jgi:hypothetical protein
MPGRFSLLCGILAIVVSLAGGFAHYQEVEARVVVAQRKDQSIVCAFGQISVRRLNKGSFARFLVSTNTILTRRRIGTIQTSSMQRCVA